MYEALPMDLAERCCQANGDAQEASQFERMPLVPLKNPVQWFTARILEYEDGPSFVTSNGQSLGRPRRIEFGGDRVLVLKPPESLMGRLLVGEADHHQRR